MTRVIDGNKSKKEKKTVLVKRTVYGGIFMKTVKLMLLIGCVCFSSVAYGMHGLLEQVRADGATNQARLACWQNIVPLIEGASGAEIDELCGVCAFDYKALGFNTTNETTFGILKQAVAGNVSRKVADLEDTIARAEARARRAQPRPASDLVETTKRDVAQSTEVVTALMNGIVLQRRTLQAAVVASIATEVQANRAINQLRGAHERIEEQLDAERATNGELRQATDLLRGQLVTVIEALRNSASQ